MSLPDGWTSGHITDKMFNNLMENGYDRIKKENTYIEQIVDKLKYFRIKSPNVCFDIHEPDLDNETIKQKDIYIQDCKTREEKYFKLNPIITEVIARITEQAKPRILAGASDDNMGLQRSLNEIRELVSFKWGVIDRDGKGIVGPVDAIKNQIQNSPKPIAESKRGKTVFDIDEKGKYFFYKYGNGIPIAESVLIKNIPAFLQIENGPILSELIDLDNQILIPPDKPNCLSKEYVFSDMQEIEEYAKRAGKENLDTLFEKVKNVWKKYFDIDDETLTLCAADTIFTYFQDRLGMTHYLLFVGDNNTGKSNALRVFQYLGYRPLFDTSITPANIYNFLGQFEEGQGTILEDEIDTIEQQIDKMRIYKVGYVSGAKVTRIYDSTNGNKGKGQQRYNTFCFKAFGSEKQPSYKGKGLSERIFTINCSPGTPLFDISEVINDAGDPKCKKLLREMEDLRKLLLVFRIIHYNDPLHDIQLSIRNRDKQLCKPVLRLFKNTKAIDEIAKALSRYLFEKNKKKLNSFDSYLYSLVSDLVKDANIEISNETLWYTICSLPGSSNPYKPQSYQTDEFGAISKTMVTRICEDKFGAIKGHNGEKRSLIFNKNTLQKLKGNYSAVKGIEILDRNKTTNTSNTFNTFWKCVDGNGIHNNNPKSDRLANSRQKK